MKMFVKLLVAFLFVVSNISAIGIHGNGKGISKNLYIKTIKKLLEIKDISKLEKLEKCISKLELSINYNDKIIDQMHERIAYLQSLKKDINPEELLFLQIHINNAKAELEAIIEKRDIQTSQIIDSCIFEPESFNF